MLKTDVSALYKTKLCKKFSANGYCPYGMRCQFIHDISEASPAVLQSLQPPKKQQKQEFIKENTTFVPKAQPWVPKKAEEV